MTIITCRNFFLLSLLCLYACQGTKRIPSKEVTTSTGLIYEILQEGAGESAQEGDDVMIHESTSYSDGTLIFSTSQIGHPIKIRIGARQAIEGVDEGLRGMKVGEIRKLIVPPALCKRTEYPPSLSPDSTLYYEIELVEIVK